MIMTHTPVVRTAAEGRTIGVDARLVHLRSRASSGQSGPEIRFRDFLEGVESHVGIKPELPRFRVEDHERAAGAADHR